MATEKRRLIDANELRQTIESKIYWGGVGLLEAIDDAPTVDAVEVVHARWVERRYDGMGGGWYALFHCPECDTPSAKPRNYCSFCGAKMDGERKDNDIRRP